jgi:hypothetical protein
LLPLSATIRSLQRRSTSQEQLKRKKMSKREIVEYYGQQWENVKHMKAFISSLVERYKEETR